jgi:hypothetical protein
MSLNCQKCGGKQQTLPGTYPVQVGEKIERWCAECAGPMPIVTRTDSTGRVHLVP